MDAHTIYVKFHNNPIWIPGLSEIKNAIDSQDVHLLELITLMMAERERPLTLDNIGLDDTTKNILINMISQSSILYESVASHRGGESKGGDTPLTNSRTEPVDSHRGGESKGGAETPLTNSTTEAVEPHRGGESKRSVLKAKMSFVADPSIINECSTLFLDKSKSKIRKIAELFKLYEPMLWTKRSASRIEAGKAKYEKEDFILLDETDRFVHVSSFSVFDFVSALKRKEVKTFSWSMKSEDVINLVALRQRLKSRLFVSATNDDVTVFVIILCSIGLPIFNLISEENFLNHWYSGRFKKLTSENIIRTLCKDMFPPEKFADKLMTPETEARLFLDAYDKSKFSLFGTESLNVRPDTYMFRRWYWYPNKDELSTIVERAKSIFDAV